jgi:hypothetical protein
VLHDLNHTCEKLMMFDISYLIVHFKNSHFIELNTRMCRWNYISGY